MMYSIMYSDLGQCSLCTDVSSQMSPPFPLLPVVEKGSLHYGVINTM